MRTTMNQEIQKDLFGKNGAFWKMGPGGPTSFIGVYSTSICEGYMFRIEHEY